MAWHLEGTYFENCNCDMVCPCTTSGMTAAADRDRCNVVLVFHIAKGDVEGTDVGGLNVAMVGDTPPVMAEGNWRVGLFMDAAASPAQAEGLGGVFGGQKGGVFEALGPLIGEMIGMETAPFQYSDNGRNHTVKIGEFVEMEVEDFVSPLDETGKGVHVTGVGFPADTLAVGHAKKSTFNAFGMKWDNAGKNSASARFAWSA